jgi:hypothetical protein
MQGDKLVAVANGGGCRIVASTAEAPLRGRVGVIAVEKKGGRTKGKGYRSFQACMQCSGGSGTRQSCGWPVHPNAGRKRACGRSMAISRNPTSGAFVGDKFARLRTVS